MNIDMQMTSLKYYQSRLSSMKPAEIMKMAAHILRQGTFDCFDRISARLFGTVMSDDEFLKKSWKDTCRFEDANELKTYFQDNDRPAFCAASYGEHQVLATMSGQFPGVVQETVKEADKVCGNTIPLLGAGNANLGERINWHTDFTKHYAWDPETYFRDIKIPYGRADIKVPWELSRFQFVASLGTAYHLTKNEKYAQKFTDLIESWISYNRPKYGINWHCTMDVAIRVCNWIAGYHYFKDSPSLSGSFFIKFLKSLYQHGTHIMANLENLHFPTHNHYISNIVGMLFLGVMFPEFDRAGQWKAFAVQELKREMKKQVYHDGTDFEASTCYHRLSLELFFYGTLVTVINDDEFNGGNHGEITDKVFGRTYAEKLLKMFHALLCLLKPDGRMPQIGDNDNGRLFIFEKPGLADLDMRCLPAMGAVFFNEPSLKACDSEECRSAVLAVFGKKELDRFDSMGKRSMKDMQSVSFPDSGWYVMRSSHDHMIISCGPNGQNGNGGHAHNDKLSFELCLGDEDIIVDPGTYVYTAQPDMRNLFRSTEYHNTVAISGHEQNRWYNGPQGLFRLCNDSRPRVLNWSCSEERDLFEGEHYGFQAQGIIHRREIAFMKTERRIVIKDWLKGSGTPFGTACFHLPPDRKITSQVKDAVTIGKFRITFHNAVDVNVSDYDYSQKYGVKERAAVIKVYFKSSLTSEIERLDE